MGNGTRLSTLQLAVFGPLTLLMALASLRMFEWYADEGENRYLVRGVVGLALTTLVLSIVLVELIRRLVERVRRRREG